MDSLQEKHHTTTRNLTYRYYISPSTSTSSDKPTLLLCHGWPDAAELWRFMIPHLLKSGLRIIAPDLLGAGKTSKPVDPKAFEIKAMVEDVKEILTAEGVEKNVIPVGHDWGSYFAQRYYLFNTPQMAGLITLNVALMPTRSEPFNLDAANTMTEKLIGYLMYAYWEFFATVDGPKQMVAHLASVWHACHGASDAHMLKLFCNRGAMAEFITSDQKDPAGLLPYAQDEAFENAWIATQANGGLQSQNCWYRAHVEGVQDASEKVLAEGLGNGKVEKPYLFVGANGDAVCRTDFIEMPKQMGLVPDSEVVELESRHWVPYEKPEEAAGVIVGWLKKRGFADGE
ncbi:alpha/beta-hydrolase like protein [Zymoseptoria brevis]|uniref:Alpha/beta-hydrolase like protein n=1 Tax=Zymoseptoria brevis TaxID=1047168 RepID=A0A0F4G5Y0_9PEZI|nr:alpha/beta-hydrolase like protein [Zymoseptoria brevis]